jgi:hypothetical protein
MASVNDHMKYIHDTPSAGAPGSAGACGWQTAGGRWGKKSRFVTSSSFIQAETIGVKLCLSLPPITLLNNGAHYVYLFSFSFSYFERTHQSKSRLTLCQPASENCPYFRISQSCPGGLSFPAAAVDYQVAIERPQTKGLLSLSFSFSLSLSLSLAFSRQ